VTFDELSEHAWREWNAMLGRVRVTDDCSLPSMVQAQSLFYSNLYVLLTEAVTGQSIPFQYPKYWL
jgi:putative alpha-1,2-mannosidase